MNSATTPPWLDDGDEVIISGRHYWIELPAADCSAGRGHCHAEPHADGTPGGERYHHHHTRFCASEPRKAVLHPVDAEPRHKHDFAATGAGREECACGAWRQELPPRPGRHPTGRLLAYYRPPDADHPNGWHYTRREKA